MERLKNKGGTKMTQPKFEYDRIASWKYMQHLYLIYQLDNNDMPFIKWIITPKSYKQ